MFPDSWRLGGRIEDAEYKLQSSKKFKSPEGMHQREEQALSKQPRSIWSLPRVSLGRQEEKKFVAKGTG